MLPADMHGIVAFNVANFAALAGVVVVEGEDEGKVAKTLDTGNLYVLNVADPPSWALVGGGDPYELPSVLQAIADLSLVGQGGKVLAVNVGATGYELVAIDTTPPITSHLDLTDIGTLTHELIDANIDFLLAQIELKQPLNENLSNLSAMFGPTGSSVGRIISKTVADGEGFEIKDLNIEFEIVVASAVWEITHNLHYLPAVKVFIAGEEVLAEISYTSLDVLEVRLASSAVGTVILT